MRRRGAGGRLDLLHAGVRPGVGDVGGDRVVEQERLLRDQGDPAPQGGQRRLAHVSPVHGDPATGGIVEPRRQVQQRALARARRPHQGDDLAPPDVKADVAQHPRAVAVGKAHPLERQCLHIAAQRLCARRIGYGRGNVQRRQEPPPRRRSLRHHRRQVRHLPQRLPCGQQRRQEGGEGPRIRRAGRRLPALVGQHRGDHDHGQGLRHRRRGGAGVVAADQMRLPLRDHPPHPLRLESLPVLQLDHPNPRQTLQDHPGEVCRGVHGPFGRLRCPPGVPTKHQAHHWPDQQHEQGQPPVHVGHHRQGAGQGQALLRQVDQAAGGRFPHQAGVIEHLGDIAAAVRGPQLRQIGSDQRAEQIPLQIADNGVADEVDGDGLDHLGHAPAYGEGYNRQRKPHQGTCLGVHDQIVHRRLQQPQQQRLQPREQHRARQRQRQPRPVPRQICPRQPGDHRARLALTDRVAHRRQPSSAPPSVSSGRPLHPRSHRHT